MYCFVLNRSDFKEVDQIVTLYSWEKGKIQALARGIKKITSKNSAFLEPVFLLEADIIPGKELDHLTKAVPLYCYKNILNNLEKLVLVRIVFSWLATLTEAGQRDSKIFLLVKSWLEFLNETQLPTSALAYSFLANLIDCLGFLPNLVQCAFCDDKKDLISFYPAAASVVCKNCFLIKKQAVNDIYPIRSVDLQAIKFLFSKQWTDILNHNTEIANRLVFLYAQYHSERKLAKLKFI